METKNPKQPAPPAYITENDKLAAQKLGKFLVENAEWKGLSTKGLMEIHQLLMWYNTLPKKLEDNVMEPKRFTQTEPEAPKKKVTRKKQ